ncbi:ABC transporter permease [Brachybacterium hainanense]|uniref:ABC transporter permease n=1 Tax=Brachybacterium hainanense TaxID=1541174 RepID=A0ABV6RA14_9MICO
MIAIALAELRMLMRNRLVALSAIGIPLGFAALLIAARDTFGGAAVIAPLIVLAVTALGIYITATTTLAARRQSLFLKRLRSTPVGDPGILTGLLAPLLVVNAVQLAVILGVISVLGDPPADPLGMVLGILALNALFLGFAIVTAGLTTSAEHAQFTTMPLFLLALGAGYWITFTGTEELAVVKRLIPGGAAAELMTEAWRGIPAADMLPLLLPTLAWVVVGFLLTPRLFRWEPRR